MTIRTYTTSERLTPTNFNTYSLNNGLKWLDTQTASGSVSSLTSDVFTTEFNSYRIVIDQLRTSSSSTDSFMVRLRTSSGDYSGSTYQNVWNGALWTSSGGIATGSGANQSYFWVTDGATTRYQSAVIELNNVRTSCKPTMTYQSVDTNNNTMRVGTCFVNNTADYIGIKLYSQGGSNFTSAKMSIYGYRKP